MVSWDFRQVHEQHPISVEAWKKRLKRQASGLQTYRYLFVGYFDTYLTEIKSLFPNSVFLTNANKDIAGVQVDFIVIATKYLSHSMFYKVKSSTIYTEVPNILCNSTSMDSFLAEMERPKENVLAQSILLAIGFNINKLHHKIMSGRTGTHLFEVKEVA